MISLKKNKKVCVVGLDGVPYTLLQRFITDNSMPALANILKNGYLKQMKVPLPAISSVSWSSFMTGTNPGTHGIFGFVDIKPNSYKVYFPTFHDLKSPTFWDKLGIKKKRSIIINQPGTYPVREINGILVSGFVAPKLDKAVFPQSYIKKLKEFNYQIDIDTLKARKDHNFLIKDLDNTLQSRKKCLDLLWDSEKWDYFQIVITGTDRLHHYLWDALIDEKHQFHNDVINYYKKIDKFIEEVYNRFIEKTKQKNGEGFFILSDHGFTQINQEVYLNSFLKQEGYLKFKEGDELTLESITEDTKAFVVEPSRIYIHKKENFPKGCVKSDEVIPLKEELKAKLKNLEFKGEKVIKEVFETSKIYKGPYSKDTSDLIVLSYPGFDLKGSLKEKDIFIKTDLQGMHTWDDAFFWSVEDINKELSITEISEIILYLMN